LCAARQKKSRPFQKRPSALPYSCKNQEGRRRSAPAHQRLAGIHSVDLRGAGAHCWRLPWGVRSSPAARGGPSPRGQPPRQPRGSRQPWCVMRRSPPACCSTAPGSLPCARPGGQGGAEFPPSLQRLPPSRRHCVVSPPPTQTQPGWRRGVGLWGTVHKKETRNSIRRATLQPPQPDLRGVHLHQPGLPAP